MDRGWALTGAQISVRIKQYGEYGRIIREANIKAE
jgi:hypothetical protein